KRTSRPQNVDTPWQAPGFSRSGDRIAAMDGSELKVWDARDGAELGKLLSTPVLFAFQDTEDRLFLVDRKRNLLLWSVGESQAKLLCTLEGQEDMAFASNDLLWITNDGKRVIYLAHNQDPQTFYSWELPAGAKAQRIPVALGQGKKIQGAVSADGS